MRASTSTWSNSPGHPHGGELPTRGWSRCVYNYGALPDRLRHSHRRRDRPDPTRPSPSQCTAITPDKALRLLGCSETNGCQARHTELQVFESETAWPLSLAWRVTRWLPTGLAGKVKRSVVSVWFRSRFWTAWPISRFFHAYTSQDRTLLRIASRGHR